MRFWIEIALTIIAMFLILSAPRWVEGAEKCETQTLVIGAWSNHVIEPDDEVIDRWNETHRALGYRCDGVGIARFTNSYGDESYSISKTFYFHETRSTRVGIYTAMWTGYKKLVGEPGFLPVGALKVDKRVYHHLWVGLLLTPPIQAVQTELRF